MKRLIVLALALLTGLVGYLRATAPGEAPAPAPKPQEEAARQSPDRGAEEARAREQAEFERASRAYAEQLAAKEAQKQLRAKAAERMTAERNIVRFNHQGAWSALISTNWETFQALRREAAHAPRHQIACTICNGVGELNFCIMCDHSDGKCTTCRGTGILPSNELCPACLGTGKCYFCGGSGRMACPFCDDGMISFNGAVPSPVMPSH